MLTLSMYFTRIRSFSSTVNTYARLICRSDSFFTMCVCLLSFLVHVHKYIHNTFPSCMSLHGAFLLGALVRSYVQVVELAFSIVCLHAYMYYVIIVVFISRRPHAFTCTARAHVLNADISDISRSHHYRVHLLIL